MRHLISILELERRGVSALLDTAERFRDGEVPRLSGVIGLLFLAASTRTRVGFEVAAYRLGLNVAALVQTKSDSGMSASESLLDTIRVVSGYVDALCVRCSNDEIGAVALAAAHCPVVNCGMGHAEHPTQALADLFTIRTLRGGIDGARVAIIGDLAHMRAAHSLLLALALFDDVDVCCIAPPQLGMPAKYARLFVARGHTLKSSDKLDPRAFDFVYVAGFPARAHDDDYSPAIRQRFAITYEVAARLPVGTAVLCPLPRIDEIDPSVDELPVAQYFLQSDLALWTRMAVLECIHSQGRSAQPKG